MEIKGENMTTIYPSVDEIVKILLDVDSLIAPQGIWEGLFDFDDKKRVLIGANEHQKMYLGTFVFPKLTDSFVHLHGLYRKTVKDVNLENDEYAQNFIQCVNLLRGALGTNSQEACDNVLGILVDRQVIKDDNLKYRLLRRLRSNFTRAVATRILNDSHVNLDDFEEAIRVAETSEDRLNLARGVAELAKKLIKEEEVKKIPNMSRLEGIYRRTYKILDKIVKKGGNNTVIAEIQRVFDWGVAKPKPLEQRITKYDALLEEKILELERQNMELRKQIRKLSEEVMVDATEKINQGVGPLGYKVKKKSVDDALEMLRNQLNQMNQNN